MKNKFKQIFELYINEGWDKIDIKLRDGRVVLYDNEVNSYIFHEGHFSFGGNGLSVTIDYRAIRCIEI